MEYGTACFRSPPSTSPKLSSEREEALFMNVGYWYWAEIERTSPSIHGVGDKAYRSKIKNFHVSSNFDNPTINKRAYLWPDTHGWTRPNMHPWARLPHCKNVHKRAILVNSVLVKRAGGSRAHAQLSRELAHGWMGGHNPVMKCPCSPMHNTFYLQKSSWYNSDS